MEVRVEHGLRQRLGVVGRRGGGRLDRRGAPGRRPSSLCSTRPTTPIPSSGPAAHSYTTRSGRGALEHGAHPLGDRQLDPRGGYGQRSEHGGRWWSPSTTIPISETASAAVAPERSARPRLPVFARKGPQHVTMGRRSLPAPWRTCPTGPGRVAGRRISARPRTTRAALDVVPEAEAICTATAGEGNDVLRGGTVLDPHDVLVVAHGRSTELIATWRSTASSRSALATTRPRGARARSHLDVRSREAGDRLARTSVDSRSRSPGRAPSWRLRIGASPGALRRPRRTPRSGPRRRRVRPPRSAPPAIGAASIPRRSAPLRRSAGSGRSPGSPRPARRRGRA